MKTFRYELGHDAMRTMTVAELIEKLKEYPSDMPVLTTWEGTCNAVVPKWGFEVVEGWSKGHKDDACDVLMIDAEQNGLSD